MPATTSLNRVLGSRIRKARKGMPRDNGRPVSQHTFAEQVGVHVVTVSQWERGKATPKMAHLVRIAEVTDRPLEFFAGEPREDDSEDDDDEDADLVIALMRAMRGIARHEADRALRARGLGSTLMEEFPTRAGSRA